MLDEALINDEDDNDARSFSGVAGAEDKDGVSDVFFRSSTSSRSS